MSLNDMEAPAVAAWVNQAGSVLLAKDPVLAASTFAKLSDTAASTDIQARINERLARVHKNAADIDATIKSVALRHAVTVAAITGFSRKSHIVSARAHAAYNLRHMNGLTYTAIGGALKKHHTSAIKLVADWKRFLEERGPASSSNREG